MGTPSSRKCRCWTKRATGPASTSCGC
jgi:hypothetical protein